MTRPNQSNEMSKTVQGLFLLFPAVLIGLLGGFTFSSSGNHSFISGFLWGFGIAVVGFAVIALVMFVWEWIKKEAYEGKMRPYMLSGLIVAIVVSGYFALSLGNPTCIESDTDNRGSTCIEYANDGFEVTTEQSWKEFWSKLPVTTIICLLIAYIAHTQVEKDRRPKHLKSENKKTRE